MRVSIRLMASIAVCSMKTRSSCCSSCLKKDVISSEDDSEVDASMFHSDDGLDVMDVSVVNEDWSEKYSDGDELSISVLGF